MKLSTERIALGLFFVGAVFFLISASGQDSGYWQDGPEWLGAVGWFGFLISLLLLACTGLYALAQRVLHHGDRSIPH